MPISLSASPNAMAGTVAAPRLILRAEAWRSLILHCETAYPQEACGALLAGWESARAWVGRIAPLRNVAADPLRAFHADPEGVHTLIVAERRGFVRVLGFYHSHPDADARPSARDLALVFPGYWHLIAAVRAGRYTEARVACPVSAGTQAGAFTRRERGLDRG